MTLEILAETAASNPISISGILGIAGFILALGHLGWQIFDKRADIRRLEDSEKVKASLDLSFLVEASGPHRIPFVFAVATISNQGKAPMLIRSTEIVLKPLQVTQRDQPSGHSFELTDESFSMSHPKKASQLDSGIFVAIPGESLDFRFSLNQEFNVFSDISSRSHTLHIRANDGSGNVIAEIRADRLWKYADMLNAGTFDEWRKSHGQGAS